MYPLSHTFLGSLEIAQKQENPSFVKTGTHFLRKAFERTDFTFNSGNAPYMVDYTVRNYGYVHKAVINIVGYSAAYFLKNGVDAYVGKWHPDDFEIYNQDIFPENLSFLSNHAPEKSVNFVFSHTFRIKTQKGDFATLLQRSSFILSPEGVPLGTVGYVTDITPFKRDKCMTHVIECLHMPGGTKKAEVIYQKNYYPELTMLDISRREAEVLRWICDGLSSKQIAEKMRISINTVNNHRKSMLQKTNCANSFELLSFAVKNGII